MIFYPTILYFLIPSLDFNNSNNSILESLKTDDRIIRSGVTCRNFPACWTNPLKQSVPSSTMSIRSMTLMQQSTLSPTSITKKSSLSFLCHSKWEIIPVLNEITQIYRIYLFNSTDQNEDHWSTIYRTVKGCFDDMTSLCDRIKHDTKQYERDILPFHILPAESSLTNTNSTLTKEIICMMEDDDLHENMIDYCRSQYANNHHVLKMIDEFDQNFEKYSPITWYTREGFLYKMLNKALRANDIKPLFFLHNYVRRLHQQLVELHRQSVRTEPLILYRGQQMSTVDFENIKNNIGGLLSVSNFLSTTAAADIAEIYAGHPLDDQTVCSILFQLYIDPSVNSTPYADIQKFSFFEGAEREYLFSMGSVFRIDKVRQRDDQVWLVYL